MLKKMTFWTKPAIKPRQLTNCVLVGPRGNGQWTNFILPCILSDLQQNTSLVVLNLSYAREEDPYQNLLLTACLKARKNVSLFTAFSDSDITVLPDIFSEPYFVYLKLHWEVNGGFEKINDVLTAYFNQIISPTKPFSVSQIKFYLPDLRFYFFDRAKMGALTDLAPAVSIMATCIPSMWKEMQDEKLGLVRSVFGNFSTFIHLSDPVSSDMTIAGLRHDQVAVSSSVNGNDLAVMRRPKPWYEIKKLMKYSKPVVGRHGKNLQKAG